MIRCRCLVLALTALLICGNAAVVQIVAWGSMLVERSQRLDVVAAVIATFDGSAPCRMCRAAEALRGDAPSAPPSHLAKLLKKAEMPSVPSLTLVVGAGESTGLPSWPMSALPVPITVAPEPPPPRTLS